MSLRSTQPWAPPPPQTEEAFRARLALLARRSTTRGAGDWPSWGGGFVTPWQTSPVVPLSAYTALDLTSHEETEE